MKTRLQKYGNSLAWRIPQHFIWEAGLAYNARVGMKEEDGNLVIQPLEDTSTLAALLAKFIMENLHHAVDPGEAIGNELWYWLSSRSAVIELG